jgi:hypothetical protein
MAGSLLVTGQHVTYWAVEQRIVCGEDRPAGNSKDHLHPFMLEALKE